MTASTCPPVPVVLFAYRRYETLVSVLASLKENRVPLLIAFLDGARDVGDEKDVERVRDLLRAENCCEIHIVERDKNFGLGKSILDGMKTIFQEFDRAIVVEDDIVLISGAYDYLCRGLEYYQNEARVLSIAAHTHPRIRPANIGNISYCSGRFACWGWAAWRRSWVGMQNSAMDVYWQCRLRGRDVNRYGADLEGQALREEKSNIWAVRFCLMHILRRGLCVQPPVPLVKNIGFGEGATNTLGGDKWQVNVMADHAPLFRPVEGGIREYPGSARRLRSVFGNKPSLTVAERYWRAAWSIKPLIHAAMARKTVDAFCIK